MTVLFSPIGTSDPLTQLGDGPMLHIVRHRDPDEVVLFLSPVMLEHERSEQRYTNAIELLSESLGRRCPIITFEESSFESVHRFDHYISEFEKILTGIANRECNKPILVNVSSGTPAMEQALVALGAFGEFDLKLLQVVTPKNGVNSPYDREDHEKYDFDTLWEINDDNDAGRPSRIEEVDTPNFKERLLKKSIQVLLHDYEYAAAYDIALQSSEISPEVKAIIQATSERLNLVGQKACKVFGGTELAYRQNDSLWEYLYTMEVKLKRGRYAEFIRMMTPALTSIMEETLRPVLPESHYLKQDKKQRVNGELDFEKIKRDEKLSSILMRDGKQRGLYISNDHLMKLLNAYCDRSDSIEKITKLRNVERLCRNKQAHQLVRSDKKAIEEAMGDVSLEDVMNMLFELHGQMKPGLYDRINEQIFEVL